MYVCVQSNIQWLAPLTLSFASSYRLLNIGFIQLPPCFKFHQKIQTAHFLTSVTISHFRILWHWHTSTSHVCSVHHISDDCRKPWKMNMWHLWWHNIHTRFYQFVLQLSRRNMQSGRQAWPVHVMHIMQKMLEKQQWIYITDIIISTSLKKKIIKQKAVILCS